jgi:hypothetical protein
VGIVLGGGRGSGAILGGAIAGSGAGIEGAGVTAGSCLTGSGAAAAVSTTGCGGRAAGTTERRLAPLRPLYLVEQIRGHRLRQGAETEPPSAREEGFSAPGFS